MSTRITDVEIQYFSDILRCCLDDEPQTRPSIKELSDMPNPSHISPVARFVAEGRYGELDVNWLTALFGSATRLHAV
jgi:hypothetical protein